MKKTTEQLERLTVKTGTTVREALRVIDRGGIGVAFVLDDSDKFVGIVTDGDIRRSLINDYNINGSIGNITNKNCITARADTPKEKLLELTSAKIRHVPIIDDSGGLVDYFSFGQFYHLPITEPCLDGNELKYVTNCIITNWVSSQGKYVTRFEEHFAKFCDTKYGIAVSNGTVALHLALLVLGVGKGDEVIVPSLTFIAPANAVTYTGAKAVFADSESLTWNIDPAQIERVITPKTKAIIPVHLYGHPADMDPILEIAKRHKLYVIEDAAEAHGATYKGRKVGSIGDMGCFSFYGNKIITTGEGGMITTNNKEWAEKVRILRDHGMSPEKKYWHSCIGFNYRLTNIQAAIGMAQLEKIERILEKKRKNARLYNQLLKKIRGIILPPETDWATNVYWMYSILVTGEYKLGRDALMSKLKEVGIETRPFFYPIHTMPPYKGSARCTVAEDLSQRGLCLPSSPNLDASEIRSMSIIIEALNK